VRRLPFGTEIAILNGRDILKMIAGDPFARQPKGSGIVRFVSVLCQRPKAAPAMPVVFPPNGAWLVKILGRDRQFVFGLYRRHMKTIGYLGKADRLFGVPLTTRNWNTITAIAAALNRGEE
jgi:hypothetical protein